MKEVSRRTFIKGMLGVVIGVGSGLALESQNGNINTAVEEHTSFKSENAFKQQMAADECSKSSDFDSCVSNYRFPVSDRIIYSTLYPVIEEGAYRGLPSFLLDASSNSLRDIDNVEIAAKSFISGSGGLTLSRRELLVGIPASLIFGLSHNVTEKGFDTNTIPTVQTTGGLMLWYLQRKFGFGSNTSAHIAFNLRYLN